jgi:hypothetical protein
VCHSRSEDDTVTVPPPKGGGCHVTDPATIDVTGCHEVNAPSLGDKRNERKTCHSGVTTAVTLHVAEGVTTLTPEQMLPLARIIAARIAQQYFRE